MLLSQGLSPLNTVSPGLSPENQISQLLTAGSRQPYRASLANFQTLAFVLFIEGLKSRLTVSYYISILFGGTLSLTKVFCQ